MIVQALSEDEIQVYQMGVPHVVISIRTPGEEPAKLPDNDSRLGVLRLAFHDAESDSDIMAKFIKRCGVGLVLFDKGMAAEVAVFLASHPSAAAVVVNCEAGISRSSGLAGAIAKAKTGDDAKFYLGRYHPNVLVYALTTEALAC